MESRIWCNTKQYRAKYVSRKVNIVLKEVLKSQYTPMFIKVTAKQ